MDPGQQDQDLPPNTAHPTYDYEPRGPADTHSSVSHPVGLLPNQTQRAPAGEPSPMGMHGYQPFLGHGHSSQLMTQASQFVGHGHGVQLAGQGQIYQGQGQSVMGMSRLQEHPASSPDVFSQRGDLVQTGPGGITAAPNPVLSTPPMQHIAHHNPSQQQMMYMPQASSPQPFMQPAAILYPQLLNPSTDGYMPVLQGLPFQQLPAVDSSTQLNPAAQTFSPTHHRQQMVMMESVAGTNTFQDLAVTSRATGEHQQVAMVPVLQDGVQVGPDFSFHPGWITEQLRTVQQHPIPVMLPPRSQQPGLRPTFLHQSGMQIRANPVDARFRTLYPLGYPSRCKPGGSLPVQMTGPNISIRGSPVVPMPMLPSDTRQSGRRSPRYGSCDVAMATGEVDPSSNSMNQLSLAGAGHTPMDTDYPYRPQVPSLLAVHLPSTDGSRSLRDIVTCFVGRTYCELGRKTYCIPQKAAVNQQHPDKALVRTREGEFRVGMALEQLSIHLNEAMFILGDYHYENFFYHLNPAKIQSADLSFMVDMINQLKKERPFGDYDFLVFHRQCGVFVVGLCSVNSNSDVQYILKRVQKARIQVEKSVAVVQRCIASLGMECPVMPIFCTPNLKRLFLGKVTVRDKVTERALATMPVLCSEQLPSQFRSKWSSLKSFEVLVDWWRKVKGEGDESRGQLSQEQLVLLVGCFLCPTLSQVDFDQSSPPAPAKKRQLYSETAKEYTPMDTSQGREPGDVVKELDLSSLILSIGNVTKSFSQYMEDYVDLYFPNFSEQTYRVPPIHFNIQKITKEGSYDILEMPMSKDTRGDEGENRVVSAVEILGLKYDVVRPVFIICDFQYNNYLNKLKETMFVKGDVRRPRRAYGQSVRAQHDCLLIHRRYGIIIISVKAVGDNFGEWASSGDEQWTAVKRTLDKVLKQLPREETMVHMVLDDLASDLPCIKLVALPNLRREDVNIAISGDIELQQKIDDMFPGQGTAAFLCMDELCETQGNIWETLEQRPDFYTNLCRWWDRVVGLGRPDVLSEQLYKQIIGRFCGLLSTIEVWSLQTPRVEVRSQAEAVQETAERFARILLTPEQVTVLNSPCKFVFLWGPPGTGKTLMLILRAERWIAGGGYVVVLNIKSGSLGLPLGHLLEKQISKMVQQQRNLLQQHQQTKDSSHGRSLTPTPTASSRSSPSPSSPSHPPSHSPSSPVPPSSAMSGPHVQRVDMDSGQFDPQNPGRLADIPPGAFILVDEVTRDSHCILSWVVQHSHPDQVWCAGQFQECCPPDFEAVSLNRVLRCPPMVQRVLQHTSSELGSPGKDMSGADALQYNKSYVPSSAPHGLSTDGSRPWLIFHSQHNSSSPLPLECSQCGRELLKIFNHNLRLQSSPMEQAKRRKLGPLPVIHDTLTLKDVVIISPQVASCAFITALKKDGLTVKMITDTADPFVAVPTSDAVVFTTPSAMTGLERKVVVYVPFEAKDPLEGERAAQKEERMGGSPVDDLRVRQALDEMVAEDRMYVWYTASRCMAQLIIVVP